MMGTKQPAAYLYSENGQIVGECMSLAPGSVVSIVEFARSRVDDETPLRTLPRYRVRGGTALRAKQLETCDRMKSIQTPSTCKKSKRKEKSLRSKDTHKHRKCVNLNHVRSVRRIQKNAPWHLSRDEAGMNSRPA